MIDQALQQVIDWISNIAPEVWRIAIRQVQANAFETAIWTTFGFIIGISALIIGIKSLKAFRKNGNDGVSFAGIWIGFGTSILAFPISVGGLATIVHYLYNPEFYAIQLLISTLTGK